MTRRPCSSLGWCWRQHEATSTRAASALRPAHTAQGGAQMQRRGQWGDMRKVGQVLTSVTSAEVINPTLPASHSPAKRDIWAQRASSRQAEGRALTSAQAAAMQARRRKNVVARMVAPLSVPVEPRSHRWEPSRVETGAQARFLPTHNLSVLGGVRPQHSRPLPQPATCKAALIAQSRGWIERRGALPPGVLRRRRYCAIACKTT